MRQTVGAVLALAVLLLGAAPAAPPDYPVRYIHLDELKALLDRGDPVDIIDVRPWASYVHAHIKGARSMPIASVVARAAEISRTGWVVFY